ADVPRLANREDVLIVLEGAPAPLRRIVARDDGEDAREIARAGRVDIQDASVGVRAAEHASLEDSGELHIRDVLRGAGDLVQAAGPPDVVPDDVEPLLRTERRILRLRHAVTSAAIRVAASWIDSMIL